MILREVFSKKTIIMNKGKRETLTIDSTSSFLSTAIFKKERKIRTEKKKKGEKKKKTTEKKKMFPHLHFTLFR